MNGEVKELLEKVLGMQLECTKILANVLCNSNNFEQVEKNQGSKNKQIDSHSQDPQKAKLLHQNSEKEQETGSVKKNSIKRSKLIQHSPQTNQETALIIDDDITTQKIDELLEELLEQEPKGKLKPQECYNFINNLMNQFRNLNQKKIKHQKMSNDQIIEGHDAKIFQNLRSVLKSFVNSIENQVEPKETNSNHQLLYSCPSCDFKGIQPVHLAHILKKHCSNYYLFSCFSCLKDFQSHKLMMKHVQNNHLDHPKERRENIKKKVKPIEELSDSEEQGVSIVL